MKDMRTLVWRRYGGKSMFYGKNLTLGNNALCGLLFILNCGILQALPIQTISSLALDAVFKIKLGFFPYSEITVCRLIAMEQATGFQRLDEASQSELIQL